jgi:hypothetical protein
LKPARVLQTVHFGVAYDATLLNSLIMSATDNLAVDHQDGADGNAALPKPFSRFFNCDLKEIIHTG